MKNKKGILTGRTLEKIQGDAKLDKEDYQKYRKT